MPANGREKRSVAPSGKKNHCFTEDVKKLGLQFKRSVRCEGKIWNEPPTPSPTLPPLLRGRGGGRGAHIGCLKKVDYFKRSSLIKDG